MILRALREGLGRIFILIDFLTRPRPMRRSEAGQREVDQAAKSLALYQFYACPFCLRVRRNLHRLNVPVETRDAQHDPRHRAELLEGGGAIKVPCLRIEDADGVRWLYESVEINGYLNRRFEEPADGATARG